MKSLFFVLSLVFAVTASASTSESRSVRFDGSAESAVLSLRAEKTHTEYRYEQVPRTCYRNVVVGHRRVCRQPTPTQPGQCWSEPIYRTEPYTCWETVRIPYEVFDYYVQAELAINFGALPAGLAANEVVTATLSGDSLTLRSSGTRALIVELAALSQAREMRGNTLMIDASAQLAFHALAPVKAALNMNSVSIKQNVMTYTLGPIADVGIKHSLKILDNPVLGSSTTLFNGEIGAQVSSEERGAITAMRIAFADVLGRELGRGRYSVTAKASFLEGATILNAHETGELSVEKTILYKR